MNGHRTHVQQTGTKRQHGSRMSYCQPQQKALKDALQTDAHFEHSENIKAQTLNKKRKAMSNNASPDEHTSKKMIESTDTNIEMDYTNQAAATQPISEQKSLEDVLKLLEITADADYDEEEKPAIDVRTVARIIPNDEQEN